MNETESVAKRNAEKLEIDQKFIPFKLIEKVVKETNIPKETVEEKNSELFYETLNGIGILKFTNDVSYKGQVKNGILETEGGVDGKGEISFPDNTVYVGEIHNNKITGEGVFTFQTGSTYTGGVLNGIRNGKGIFQSPAGITYEGEWLNGLKHGKGKLTRPEMTYEGEWANGRIEGLGKLIWRNKN
ncbi:MAG: hypothetical protein MJ252_06695, partial [archaeon]|nr:hypothetical protein [archaeon]